MTDPTHNIYPRSPIPSTGSYDSSSVSSTTSPRTQGIYDGGLMGASPRPLSGHMSQHLTLTSGPPLGQGAFHHSYNSAATSPSVLGMDSMTSNGSSNGTPGPSVAHMSSANIQAQKRAYRQRRKDPSCDACRERKVKCDATETSSCSECSSRSVKCQFTKETNRRMSSIKQVQDLEKQIAQIKRENGQLRTMLSMREGQMDIDTESAVPTSIHIPEIGLQPKKISRASPPPYDFSRARSNIRNFGRGIFNPPAPYRQSVSQPDLPYRYPDLPPKEVAYNLLRCYYSSVHIMMPVLHWPQFEREYEEGYKIGSFHNKSQVWISLFFAVLAVGVLYNTEPNIQRAAKGKEFIDASHNAIEFFSDEYTIDHARATLLISVFLNEMNLKHAASIWLGSAVQIAQDIGLHREGGLREVAENETRRRVWWAIYVFDRQLGLELGRPLLIDDADCDTNLPSPIDEMPMPHPGYLSQNGTQRPANILLPIVHTMRCVGPLLRTLRCPLIPSTALATFDSYFASCMSTLQPCTQITSAESLDPTLLSPIIHLLNVRLILHRHNLSPYAPPETRATAVEQCILAALDTSSLLARITSPSFPALANSLACMHFWRCALFLLFGGHIHAALACVRASASIGRNREVNVGCGRNVTLFLEVLIEKRRSGLGNRREMDEELLAYISGDMQGNAEESWVWSGEISPRIGGSPKRDGYDLAAGWSDVEIREWGGWDRLLYLVDVLAREQGPTMGAGNVNMTNVGTPNLYMPEPPRSTFGGMPNKLPSPPQRRDERRTGNERMSIGNII